MILMVTNWIKNEGHPRTVVEMVPPQMINHPRVFFSQWKVSTKRRIIHLVDSGMFRPKLDQKVWDFMGIYWDLSKKWWFFMEFFMGSNYNIAPTPKKFSENLWRPGNSGDTKKSTLPHDHHLYAWQLWDDPSVLKYMISMVIFWDHLRHLYFFRILQLIPSEWVSSARNISFPVICPCNNMKKTRFWMVFFYHVESHIWILNNHGWYMVKPINDGLG